MRIIDLETINQAMNNETQFVLRCEEVFHDKVSSAAAAVLSAGRERRIVALTGPCPAAARPPPPCACATTWKIWASRSAC